MRPDTRPDTRYVDTTGGQIAYQVVGDGPFDLVYMHGVISQLDMRWELAQFRHFLERLASFSRLILFDRRGSGLSDPLPGDVVIPTWEEWSEDLHAVLDEVGSTQASIIAMIDAGPMAMLFAASHPDRVRSLVLANTSACLGRRDDYPIGLDEEFRDAFADQVAATWGRPDPRGTGNPSIANDRQLLDWYARYMRASCTPRRAAAQLTAEFSCDVRPVLPLIRCPTQVIHARLLSLPVEHGRYLAEHIAGARLVELDHGDAGLMFQGADYNLAVIEEFLTGVTPTHPPTDRQLATVVFTDLVDSTRRAAAMGDRAWRELMVRHDELLHEYVRNHGGRVWKSTGDGAMVTFDAPGRAIRCLQHFNHALDDLGLQTRAGVHAGEIETRHDDIGGIAVNIGARVMEAAGAKEILVSRTVADLVAGSELVLVDRGARELKGVPGSWNLYAVGG